MALHDDVIGPDPQLLRIVQESLANVLKHARAGRMPVSATVEDGMLVLEVADTRESAGRGLRNTRRRAAEAGATIEIGPRGGRYAGADRALARAGRAVRRGRRGRA
jgi:glucose-6-phosphate-specific signal transduction histidine kinase